MIGKLFSNRTLLALIEDLAVYTTQKLATLVEVLERKGVFARREIYAAISGLVTASPSEDI